MVRLPQGGSVYARLHNPTVARFESAMALLERGDDAVAFASGMATLTAILLAAKAKGGHVVALRPLTAAQILADVRAARPLRQLRRA